jgi:hypothetical protein
LVVDTMGQHCCSPRVSSAGADPAPRDPRDFCHGLLGFQAGFVRLFNAVIHVLGANRVTQDVAVSS